MERSSSYIEILKSKPTLSVRRLSTIVTLASLSLNMEGKNLVGVEEKTGVDVD